jgi:hypothetical protein
MLALLPTLLIANRLTCPAKQWSYRLPVVNRSIGYMPNKGQWKSDALYGATSATVNAWITRAGAVYDFRRGTGGRLTEGAVLSLSLLHSHPLGFRQGAVGPSHTNYLRGSNRARWVTGLEQSDSVTSANAYPGINAVHYFGGGRPRIDFLVQPHANPADIQIQVQGADRVDVLSSRVDLDIGGHLISLGELKTFQVIGRKKHFVPCKFVLRSEGVLAFQVGAYDHRRPLVIDPLVWSTYLGGSKGELISGVAATSTGNPVVFGTTGSSDLPTSAGAYQRVAKKPNDVFISELTSDGTGVVYTTYLGGNGDDRAAGIQVDSQDRAIISGTTTSTDFPTTPGVLDRGPISAGQQAAFVAKFAIDGSSLAFSTLMPGTASYFSCAGLSIDSQGSLFVAGGTNASDLPTSANAYQRTFVGTSANPTAGYIVKLSADATTLLAATYFGQVSGGSGMANDSLGNVLVCGHFGTVPLSQNAVNPINNQSAWLVRFSGDCSQLQLGTYIADTSLAYAVGVDSHDDPIVGGETLSSQPELAGAYQTVNKGGADAYVAKFNFDGTALLGATLLGGTGFDRLAAIAVLADDSVCASGMSTSTDFPVTFDAVQASNAGGYDFFVVHLSPDFSALRYSTYFGGAGSDTASGLALLSQSEVYVAGNTGTFSIAPSTDFPTTAGAVDRTEKGPSDGLLVRLAFSDVFSALTVLPDTLGGGVTAQGTVRLASVAPAGGRLVQFASNDPAVTVPPSVTVPSGSALAHFNLATSAVTSDHLVTVTAQAAGASTQVRLLLRPYRAKLVAAPSTVVGGNPTICTVTVNTPAPASGKSIALTANGSSVASVPASVVIPPNAVSTTFQVTTYGTTYKHAALISASVDGSSSGCYITALPPSLASISLTNTNVIAGDSTTGRATLDGQTATNLSIAISSDNSSVAVPSSASALAHSRASSLFPVTTSFVASTQNATITGTLNNVMKSATLTVIYAPFQLSLNASQIIAGGSFQGSVTLPAPAPASGLTVNLGTNGGQTVSVPFSVTVPGASSGASFTVKTYGINRSSVKSISGTAGGITRTRSFTIIPASLSSLQLSPASVPGGSSSSGRAFLNGLNGSSSRTVTLASNNAAVSVPPSVSIPPNGNDSFAFAITTSHVVATQTVTISASEGGVTKTAVLTVTP